MGEAESSQINVYETMNYLLNNLYKQYDEMEKLSNPEQRDEDERLTFDSNTINFHKIETKHTIMYNLYQMYGPIFFATYNLDNLDELIQKFNIFYLTMNNMSVDEFFKEVKEFIPECLEDIKNCELISRIIKHCENRNIQGISSTSNRKNNKFEMISQYAEKAIICLDKYNNHKANTNYQQLLIINQEFQVAFCSLIYYNRFLINDQSDSFIEGGITLDDSGYIYDLVGFNTIYEDVKINYPESIVLKGLYNMRETGINDLRDRLQKIIEWAKEKKQNELASVGHNTEKLKKPIENEYEKYSQYYSKLKEKIEIIISDIENCEQSRIDLKKKNAALVYMIREDIYYIYKVIEKIPDFLNPEVKELMQNIKLAYLYLGEKNDSLNNMVYLLNKMERLTKKSKELKDILISASLLRAQDTDKYTNLGIKTDSKDGQMQYVYDGTLSKYIEEIQNNLKVYKENRWQCRVTKLKIGFYWLFRVKNKLQEKTKELDKFKTQMLAANAEVCHYARQLTDRGRMLTISKTDSNSNMMAGLSEKDKAFILKITKSKRNEVDPAEKLMAYGAQGQSINSLIKKFNQIDNWCKSKQNEYSANKINKSWRNYRIRQLENKNNHLNMIQKFVQKLHETGKYIDVTVLDINKGKIIIRALKKDQHDGEYDIYTTRKTIDNNIEFNKPISPSNQQLDKLRELGLVPYTQNSNGGRVKLEVNAKVEKLEKIIHSNKEEINKHMDGIKKVRENANRIK